VAWYGSIVIFSVTSAICHLIVTTIFRSSLLQARLEENANLFHRLVRPWQKKTQQYNARHRRVIRGGGGVVRKRRENRQQPYSRKR